MLKNRKRFARLSLLLFAVIFETFLILWLAPAESISQKEHIDEAMIIREERIERIRLYFAQRGMPLAELAEELFLAAEKYNLEWQLLPAIAVKESQGALRDRCNNPFGWASARICFDSYQEAIEIVAWNLSGSNPNTARYYKDKTTEEKLQAYNGTVEPTYPAQVLKIMTKF